MPTVFNRYATPFVTGLFLISLISGVALFFHWGSSWFHGMHEWLSMVLIVPFVLHIWKNWRAFSNYFKRAPMAIALVVSVVAGLAFAWPAMTSEGSERRGPPQFALGQMLLEAPISTAAPILGLSTDALSAKLTAAGYTVTGTDETLSAIATAAGQSTSTLAGALIAQ